MQTILDLVPTVTAQMTSEIKKIQDRSHPSTQSMKPLRECLRLFPIVLHLMTSPVFRTRMFSQPLIKELSFYLSQMEELTALAPEELKSTLLLVLEAISQVTSSSVSMLRYFENSSILVNQHQDIIQYFDLTAHKETLKG